MRQASCVTSRYMYMVKEKNLLVPKNLKVFVKTVGEEGMVLGVVTKWRVKG